jgi:hypothetical protein
MRSQQARSTEAASTPSTRGFGKVDLNVSVACMVHRLVLTGGGTGIGGLGDPGPGDTDLAFTLTKPQLLAMLAGGGPDGVGHNGDLGAPSGC